MCYLPMCSLAHAMRAMGAQAANPNFQYGGICGFDGWPINAWRPEDLEPFMRMHAAHGAQYHAPGCASYARVMRLQLASKQLASS